MSDTIANQLRQRMSLRKPQEAALDILAELCKTLELGKQVDTAAELAKVHALYPTVSDFERSFVSLCFALATGVGKTRLMGAFISYLAITKKSNNFFIIAPNKTIYRKLITDFSDLSHSKYVFKGIAEFAVTHPRVITGENYNSAITASRQQVSADLFEDAIDIHIFNIDKINKEGGKVKNLNELIGESYFEYLSGLDDLVILMDESHHYRADRGMAVINELQPIIGLELTATPQVETGGKTVKFKNVAFEYSLRSAMLDGYVKEPFVATRSNFDPTQYSDEEIDNLKLEDGVMIHEQTKAALEVYARNNDQRIVKPFVLVVAKDTGHAQSLRAVIESNDFYGGYYQGKVIEVHSKVSGEEKDENIESLVSLEDPDNSIEIVVHVNMLKEGWDVTNLYTIIPLRSSASATLTEQTIGRGLRLPYGQRVGDADVDRLTIVAHDRFQAIIEEANKPDSLIRRGNIITIEDNPELAQPKVIVSTGSKAFGNFDDRRREVATIVDPAEKARQSQQLAVDQATQEAIVAMAGQQVRTPELSDATVRQRIIDDVRRRVETGLELPMFENEDTTAIIGHAVDRTIKTVQQHVIEIPRLSVMPSDDAAVTIQDFDLDVSSLMLRPQSNDIYLQSLQDAEAQRQTITNEKVRFREAVIENVIVSQLIDIDFIEYETNAKLLYKLAGQAITHLRSYLANEDEVINIVYTQKQRIADFVAAQIAANMTKQPVTYDLSQTLPFTKIYDSACEQIRGDRFYHYTETITPTSAIRTKVFTGFTKACHDRYKFDSKSEKDFATLLEKDTAGTVLRWLRPAPMQFSITWGRKGSRYEPDFVVETGDVIYMVEVKKADDVETDDVQEKARAAGLYCEQASKYNAEHGGKAWCYALIPHDRISLGSSLRDLLTAHTA
ncbi:MAG TPA: DEAD/DEAH box helicase family protein [Candidatus Saccharimonadales bacterium]|jgi:type III restriction enzyme